MVPFEDANTEAYRLLLRIEVAVREIIRNALKDAHGRRWQRQLPKSMRQTIHEAQTDEEKRRQFGFRRLGPLYYLTFGELISVLRQQAAGTAATRLGGPHVIDQLETIFAPRNAVAHSRDVSDAGLAAIRLLLQQLENAVGQASLEEILRHPEVGVAAETALPEMLEWFQQTQLAVRQLAAVCPTCAMYEQATAQFWWGMSEVCDLDYVSVDTGADSISRYNLLPTGIGSAIVRQRFAEDNGMASMLAKAIGSLKKVLE